MTPCRILVYRRLGFLPSETFVRDQFAQLPNARLFYDLDGRDHGLRSRARRLGQSSAYLVGRLSVGLAEAVRDFEPDAALIHFGTNAVAVGPGLRARNVPTFPIFHGHDATVSKRHGVYADQRIAKEVEQSSVTFCVSEFIRTRLIERGAPASKLRVHYTGIDLIGHSNGDQVRVDAAPGRRAGVLFVGRLVPKKGADDLVGAYARLPEDLRVAHPLTIVGTGPDEERIRAIASRLNVSLQLLGAVGNSAVREMMLTSRVVAMPSKVAPNGDAEGLGHVALEAQAAGCPVVGYSSGGLPEAVLAGRTGWLEPEGDVDALASSLTRALTDDLAWSARAGEGPRHVRERFDIRTNTERLRATIRAAVHD